MLTLPKTTKLQVATLAKNVDTNLTDVPSVYLKIHDDLCRCYSKTDGAYMELNMRNDPTVNSDVTIRIPAAPFSDVLSSLKEAHLEIGAKHLTVKSIDDKKIAKINLIEDGYIYDYGFSVNKDDFLFEISAELLENVLQKALLAVTYDPSFAILNGVYFKRDGDNLVVISTNKYKIVQQTVSVNWKTDKDVSFVLSAQSCHKLQKVFLKLCVVDNLKVYFDGQIKMVSGDINGVFTCLSGQYPNIFKNTQASFDNTVSFNREELLGTIKFLQTITDSLVTMEIFPDRVIFTSTEKESGINEVNDQAATIVLTTCDSAKLMFNLDHLKEAVYILNGDTTMISFREQKFLYKISDNSETNIQYFTMPMTKEQ